jgi:aryl-alcohol dehydrogenase-like predicted oxidoreductase
LQYARLGRTGAKVSRICLGCFSFGDSARWQIELDEARKLVNKAIDLGVNFFDTANEYSRGRSEEILGECLKGCRDDMVVATKVGLPMGPGPNDLGLSRRHILQQIKDSLSRLQMDHVDLYQIHRWDHEVPIEETMRTLDAVVRQGWARYLGASSMFAWELLKSLHTSERLGLEGFVSMQNHYNLVYREEEREMIPLCREKGIGIIPWSPLARGFLTGKYRQGQVPTTIRYESDKHLRERYFKPEDFEVLEALENLAIDKGVSCAQLALAWLLHKDVTAPVIGATRMEHVEEAVCAMDVKLDADDMWRLESPYKPHPIIGLEGLR